MKQLNLDDLEDFDILLIGNLANGNLIENYSQYKKAEICLIAPKLIDNKKKFNFVQSLISGLSKNSLYKEI